VVARALDLAYHDRVHKREWMRSAPELYLAGAARGECSVIQSVVLSCHACNGKLQIAPDVHSLNCNHCAQPHLVKRAGQFVMLVLKDERSTTAAKRASSSDLRRHG
jgi:hypothetical protein